MKKSKKKKAISSFFVRRDSLTKFAAVCVTLPLFVASGSSILSMFDLSNIDLYESQDFWFAYMAYAATVFIGLLTFINSFVERKLQQEHETANTKCPYIEISRITAPKGKPANCYGNYYVISATSSAGIVIKNFGDGPANEITVSVNGTDINYGILRVNDELMIPIYVEPNEAGKRICANIHYKNVLGYPYLQKLEYKLVPKQVKINNHLQKIGFDLHIYNIGCQERLGEVTQDYRT